jgi:hypothetical protein
VSVGWGRESVEAVWDRGVMGHCEGWREGRVSWLWQRYIYITVSQALSSRYKVVKRAPASVDRRGASTRQPRAWAASASRPKRAPASVERPRAWATSSWRPVIWLVGK